MQRHSDKDDGGDNCNITEGQGADSAAEPDLATDVGAVASGGAPSNGQRTDLAIVHGIRQRRSHNNVERPRCAAVSRG